MTFKNHLLSIGALLLLNLTACELNDRKQETLDLADSFYQQIAQENHLKALELCSEDFFSAAGRDAWLESLAAINNKYGAYQSRHLLKWNVRSVPSANMKEASFAMAFRVIYENGETIETLSASGTQPLKISAYNVIPDKRQPRKSH